MANTPTLKVEIAFDDTPLTVSPTWTDVTDYVRDNSARISRGRPTELDTFTAGQCSFTLDNRDGRFSPLNASSPYVNKLLPGKQVRITATYSGTDYRIFRGFITGWPQRYSQGKKDAIVPIVAYDALSKLNETDLSDPVYDYITSLGTVLSFHRTLEGDLWRDAAGTRDARKQTGVIVPAESLGAGLTATGINATAGRMLMASTTAGIHDAFSYSFWIQTTGAGASSSVWMAVFSGYLVSGSGLVVGVDSAGLLRFQGVEGTPPNFPTARTLSRINDGAPHHVVIAVDAATFTLNIFVDGIDNTDTVNGYDTSASAAGQEQFIGSDTSGTHSSFTGILQDFVSFDDVALTQAQAQRIYEMGTATYIRTTGTALGEVLDSAGWPSGLRSIATNTIGDANAIWNESTNALSMAQTVASTEQGRFFVSGSGNITLLSRYSHQLDTTAITSQHTFSDDGSDSDYVDVGFNYDDTQVRNVITVSCIEGSASSTDATSVTTYGTQSASVSTALPYVALAQDMADGLVGWRKDPQVRSLPLSSVPQTDPAQWPSILALELGQRVTFEITPPGVGSQVATELILEQMDWDISNSLWELTVQGSPVPPSVAFYDVDSYDDGCVYGF